MRMLVFLAAAGLGALAHAQRREAWVGSVTGSDGSAWAGAPVVLHSPAVMAVVAVAPEDTIQVTTDERGRFRVEALPGRVYRALAFRKEAGACRLAGPVELLPGHEPLGVALGGPLRLAEDPGKAQPIELQFVGLEAWRDREVQWLLTDCLGRMSRLDVGPSGRVPVAAETGYGTIELVDRRGARLWTTELRLEAGVRREERDRLVQELQGQAAAEPVAGLPDLSREPVPPVGVERIVLGPPIEARVRVIGADDKPVADARVHWLQEPGQVPDLVARTGADGVAVLVLAASVDRLGRPAATETRVFQVVAERYAAEQCGWQSPRESGAREPGLVGLDIDRRARGEYPVLDVRLSVGRAARGVVKSAGRLPAENLTVWTSITRPAGGNRRLEVRQAVRTGESGHWSLDGFGGSSTLTPELILRREDLLALLPEGETFEWTHEAVSLGRSEDFDAVLDLSRIRFVDLDVRLPDGSPARWANVERHDWWATTMTRGPLMTTDGRGVCRMVVPHAKASVLVTTDDHYLETTVASEVKQQIVRRDLALRSLLRVTGKVVDRAGRPVPDALIKVRRPVTGDEPNQLSAGFNLLQMAWSDADGRFALRVLPFADGPVTIGASLRTGSGWTSGEIEVPVADSAPRRDWKIVLDTEHAGPAPSAQRR